MVAELAKRLKNTFSLKVYCTSDSSDQLGDHTWEGILVKVFQTYSFAYQLSLPLYRSIRGEKEVCLIHAHNYSTLIPLTVTLAQNDIPVIINPHFHRRAETKFNSLLRQVYDLWPGAYPLRRARLVVCNSNAERQSLLRKFPDLQGVQVIYNGVDLDRIRLAEPYTATSSKVILCVSRLVRYKNVHLILHALKYLPQEYKMVVIGTGSEMESLQALVAKLGLQGRVDFLGNVPDGELHRWYRTATVFAHLSEIESFGMTCIEALAAGTPVVANDDRAGLKETIELFHPYICAVDATRSSPQQIANVIEEAGHIKVDASLHGFDWDEIANQFRVLYSQVIESRGRGCYDGGKFD